MLVCKDIAIVFSEDIFASLQMDKQVCDLQSGVYCMMLRMFSVMLLAVHIGVYSGSLLCATPLNDPKYTHLLT
jgi:hypothetical protein